MEGFTYYNLFETKGLEYIITIFFFLLLVPFWILLNKDNKVGKRIMSTLGSMNIHLFNMPKGVYHSPNHLWMYMFKSGKVRVGLDEFLIRLTGEIDFSPSVTEGKELQKGEVIGHIEQGKKKIQLTSPVSGHLLSFNKDFKSDKHAVDPYGNDWLLEIKPTNWIKETSNSLTHEGTDIWIRSEMTRLKDFLAASLWKNNKGEMAQALQDGGELKDKLLQDLPEEIWKDFGTDFLQAENKQSAIQ